MQRTARIGEGGFQCTFDCGATREVGIARAGALPCHGPATGLMRQAVCRGTQEQDLLGRPQRQCGVVILQQDKRFPDSPPRQLPVLAITHGRGRDTSADLVAGVK